MTVSVNNNLLELPDDSSVISVLRTVGVHSLKGVAIAVNNQILKKEEWDSHTLKSRDVVVLIRASQGG